ncbi:PspC domain-containing protein [Cloacibacterium sp.]|uniref:PspC domain-containing protein n=1 Tax=Cloacibacterium sp. TaxID=1913682 RepID=UPI0039E29E6D
MNKTLSIGLAGFSFTIEEHAYIKLSDYLSALRSSLDATEADEVMHDIEIRIVEILREQMAKREVVNDEDVEKVIAQIGKPEVIEEQEQAYFSEKTEKPRAFSGQKQLFRDPEGKILGGVSGGLGHYFGIDKVWVRLIFIILIFAKGFGLLLYPILWLVIPVANSASDFLKMKGKPANFDNLKNESNKIVQFANESTQRVGQLYQENKHYVADAGNGFATFLRVVFGGIFALLAFSFIIGTFALFGLFGNPSFPGTSMFNFLFDEGGMNTVLIVISILTILIPAIIFTLISIKLFSPKTKLRNFGYIIGVLTLLWIGLLTFFGVSFAKNKMIYQGHKEETEEIAITTTSDSIILDQKQVVIPANFTAYNDDIFSDKKTVYDEDYPDVKIIRKEDVKTPYLIIKKTADGYNQPLNMLAPVEVQGNKIFLPNYISYPYAQRFRDYKVDYELIVPTKMVVLDPKDKVNTYGDNEKDDDDDDNVSEVGKGKIDINGTTIEYNSNDNDSVIINGKKYPKSTADSIIKRDLKNHNQFKDVKDLKNLDISIDENGSKIKIKTNK